MGRAFIRSDDTPSDSDAQGQYRITVALMGGARLSRADRAAIGALTVPAHGTRESWRVPDDCRAPVIERLWWTDFEVIAR